MKGFFSARVRWAVASENRFSSCRLFELVLHTSTPPHLHTLASFRRTRKPP